MIHYKGLHKLFLEHYPRQATNFFGLSGYVGPEPIKSLHSLPIKSTLIYGLCGERLPVRLHEQLVGLHDSSHQILYPSIKCHSKCYLWLDGETPIRGLIGSANFSTNGLYTDYRESLYEVGDRDLPMLKGYMDSILNSTKPCINWEVTPDQKLPEPAQVMENCDMVLFDPRTGETQEKNGLNWGQAALSGSHVDINDANIPIRASYIKAFPELFPSLSYSPERRRGNVHEVVDILWDDGTTMKGRMEGSQPLAGTDNKYPKNFASFPRKNLLGEYLRSRLRVPSGARVTRRDLLKYGRESIRVSPVEEGIYYFDFSTTEKK